MILIGSRARNISASSKKCTATEAEKAKASPLKEYIISSSMTYSCARPVGITVTTARIGIMTTKRSSRAGL